MGDAKLAYASEYLINIYQWSQPCFAPKNCIPERVVSSCAVLSPGQSTPFTITHSIPSGYRYGSSIVARDTTHIGMQDDYIRSTPFA
jgi:hypothetical protein